MEGYADVGASVRDHRLHFTASVDTPPPPSTHSCGPGMKETEQDVTVPGREGFMLIVDRCSNDYLTTLHNCQPPVEDLWPCVIDVVSAAVQLTEYTALS